MADMCHLVSTKWPRVCPQSLIRRQQVLCETLSRFELAPSADNYRLTAEENLLRWRLEASPCGSKDPAPLTIKVLPRD
jgi:hypothetical protein